MIGHTYSSLFVISFTVLSISASDVFIINTKTSDRLPLIERSLQTLKELLGMKALKETTLRVQLLGSNDQKSGRDKRDGFWLRPASSGDLTKDNVADLLRLLNSDKNAKKAIIKPQDVPHKLFRNKYGVPKKLNAYEHKANRPLEVDSNERLQPFVKFLLKMLQTKKVPNSKQTFKDLTRFDSSNISRDYIDIDELNRDKLIHRFSRDYIDFDQLKFRRDNKYPVKAALRTYSAEDDSSGATKSKRFEIIKNIHNKKDIKTDSETESEEIKNKKKKKAMFKKKSNKKEVQSTENAGTSLSSENEESQERVTKKSKKKRYQPAKNKNKHVSLSENDEWHEDNKPYELYLQGNKLTMYPPVKADSSDENDSDDTRRRGDRLPYFLPKRQHWNMDDIYSLGYFFYNGPKGVSLES